MPKKVKPLSVNILYKNATYNVYYTFVSFAYYLSTARMNHVHKNAFNSFDKN